MVIRRINISFMKRRTGLKGARDPTHCRCETRYGTYINFEFFIFVFKNQILRTKAETVQSFNES